MSMVAGIAIGFATQRVSSSGAHRDAHKAPVTKQDVAEFIATAPLASEQEIDPQDQVEALLALEKRELYRHLARWLLDADERQMSSFYSRYREQGGNDYEVIRLVYVNWTRLNPQGAIESTTNHEDLPHVWIGWACHAPGEALAADAEAGGAMALVICHTIGEFHPNWLFAHFDRIPVQFRETACYAVKSETFRLNNPFRTLRNAQRWKYDPLLGVAYAAAIRKSPYDAWRWFQEYRISNPGFMGGSESDNLEYMFVFLNASHARDMTHIAEAMPDGIVKRNFLSKRLELLANADPEAALAEARTAESGRTKAEHLALAGKAFVYHDPEKAFQIADEVFAACPDVFHKLRTQMSDGGIYKRPEGEQLYKIHPYYEALCVRDPERLMNSFLRHDSGFKAVDTLTTLSEIWAAHDPSSHAAWLNTQTDPRIREPAALKLVEHLASQELYADALDWSLSLGNPDASPTAKVFNQWRRFDPDSALEWLETANLPDERKTQLREEKVK